MDNARQETAAVSSLTTVSGHKSPVSHLGFGGGLQASQPLYLASGDTLGVIKICDGVTFQQKQELQVRKSKAIGAFSVSQDGNIIASSSYCTLSIWDVRQQYSRLVQSVRKRICNVSMSADGRWIAFGGLNREAHIFDTTAGRICQSFSQKAEVMSVSMAADASVVVTGTSTGLLGIYDKNMQTLEAAKA